MKDQLSAMELDRAGEFIFGVDLDGVCADFYAGIRPIAAEWLGVDEGSLATEVSYGLPEWRIDDAPGGYLDFHSSRLLNVTCSNRCDQWRVVRKPCADFLRLEYGFESSLIDCSSSTSTSRQLIKRLIG